MNSNRTAFAALPSLYLALVVSITGCAEGGGGDVEGLVDLSRALTVTQGDSTVALYDDLTVNVPARFNVPYAGMAAAEFPTGMPPAVGSGLRFRQHGPGLSFYAVTDRGPSGDSPGYLDEDGVVHTSKAFPVPTFTPEIVTVTVLPFVGPVVTSALPIRAGGENVSGLFPAGLSTEVSLTETLVALPPSATGLDPEGIDVDARGNIWLCDEYGPSLVKVHPRTGQILAKLVPGSGLPAVLSSRQNNRGFEGVAVTPNGKVYAMVQSTLDIAGSTKSKAQFLRLVEYDPASGATRMFAYPHDVAEYAKSGDAKMGDLVAVDDHRFLAIEQGRDKNKALRNLVYALDTEGASDLSGRTLADGANAGRDLEYGTAVEIAAQVTPIRKSLVLDLRAYGWTDEKAEGLSLVDDRTVVVANDQDFGVSVTMAGDPTSSDPTAYLVDATGAVSINGAPSAGSYEVHAAPLATHRSHLFVARLRQSVTTYFPR